MSVVEKVVKSGLVDRHTVALMERWGMLPEGSTESVPDLIRRLAKEQLSQLADDLEQEIEREMAMRETRLDLDRLRWPVEVDVFHGDQEQVAFLALRGVTDRMGKYYFRPEDVRTEEAIAPGMWIVLRTGGVPEAPEEVLEVQPLYVGNAVVCLQVTVRSQSA